MSAEGVPCGGVYHEQYYDGLLDEAIASRGYERLWSAERLKAYRDSFKELKGNKQVCETTVAMTQNMLLADRGDMDHILDGDSEGPGAQRRAGEGRERMRLVSIRHTS